MSLTDTIKIYNPTTDELSFTGISVSGQSAVLDPMYEGDVFVMDMPSHGMHSDSNLLNIFGVLPDTTGIPILESINLTSNSLTISDASEFGTFEGISTSIGYAYIGGEIIEYTDNNDGTLGITSRGVDGTAVLIHDQGARVYKYEMSGVSLRRINTQHQLPTNIL